MTYHLSKIGSNIFSGSSRLKDLVLPSSISQVSQLDLDAFASSSLSSVTFLGMSSSLASSIQNAKMFSVGHDCWFITSDLKRFQWIQNANIIVEDLDYATSRFGKIKAGKPDKLKLGKAIYKFEEKLYQWCTDPSVQDATKYRNPAVCPFIVIYGDFRTSVISQQFLRSIIGNQLLWSWMKDNLKCYAFLVDRNGVGICRSASAEDAGYQFFKQICQPEKLQHDFVVVNFIYGTNFISKTFSSTSLQEFEAFLLRGCDDAGFSAFDYESFNVNLLEDPYIEQIPTITPSAQSGYEPWWWNGSSAQSLPDWPA